MRVRTNKPLLNPTLLDMARLGIICINNVCCISNSFPHQVGNFGMNALKFTMMPLVTLDSHLSSKLPKGERRSQKIHGVSHGKVWQTSSTNS